MTPIDRIIALCAVATFMAIAALALAVHDANSSMATCLERNSFDTCHGHLNP